MPVARTINSDAVILIVENSPSDTGLLEDVCVQAGAVATHIHIETRIDHAIDWIENGWADLVLLDLGDRASPTTASGGIRLLEQWASICKKRRVPVIVVSRLVADLSLEEREILDSAAFGAVEKPGAQSRERSQFKQFLTWMILSALEEHPPNATVSDRLRRTVAVPDSQPVLPSSRERKWWMRISDLTKHVHVHVPGTDYSIPLFSRTGLIVGVAIIPAVEAGTRGSLGLVARVLTGIVAFLGVALIRGNKDK